MPIRIIDQKPNRLVFDETSATVKEVSDWIHENWPKFPSHLIAFGPSIHEDPHALVMEKCTAPKFCQDGELTIAARITWDHVVHVIIANLGPGIAMEKMELCWSNATLHIQRIP